MLLMRYIAVLSSLAAFGTSKDSFFGKTKFLTAYCQKPLLKCLAKKDGLLKSNFKGAVSYFTHKLLRITNWKALGQRFQV